MTWTLLALGTALARAGARAARRTRTTRRPLNGHRKRAGRRGAPHREPCSRFPRPRRARRRAALAVAVAVLVWAITRTYPNYDSYYHLVWGRELLRRHGAVVRGLRRADPAPALRRARRAARAGLRRERGPRARARVPALARARWCSAPTGSARRSSGAGAARWRALFVAASASFLLYAARGYVDSPFLALVVWAGVLEAERPRPRRAAGAARRSPGLLRPEAWVLDGPRLALVARRASAARVAAARSPSLVAPRHLGARRTWSSPATRCTRCTRPPSSPTTSAACAASQHVPGSFVSFVGATVRPPVALLAPIGAVLAWRVLGWQRAARAAGAVRGGRDHVRRHGRARASRSSRAT